jgi:hypothetical protein
MVSAQFIQAMLLQLNYIMSSLCEDAGIEHGYTLDKQQTQLADAESDKTVDDD